jgi:hypothetical protein
LSPEFHFVTRCIAGKIENVYSGNKNPVLSAKKATLSQLMQMNNRQIGLAGLYLIVKKR